MSKISRESQANEDLFQLYYSGSHREIKNFHAICENGKEKLILLLEAQKLKYATVI